MENKNYRNTILAVFLNSKNETLICLSHRDDNKWKFPQGGIENNETKSQALIREIKEELNIEINKDDIIKEGNIESYFFENGFEIKLYPYLLKFDKNKNIKLSPDEFCKFKWLKADEINNLDLGIRYKAYINILKGFQLL